MLVDPFEMNQLAKISYDNHSGIYYIVWKINLQTKYFPTK